MAEETKSTDYKLQQASVPSSPNPGRIRPYQPRRCSSQGLVLSRPYSSLSMKGAEKHRFPAVRAVEERTTSAGWRHDISRFSDLLLCPPVRRDIPCCSRTDLTADGSGFRSDARTRLRLRLATRASTKGRSREVPSARERATCLSRAAAAKARFILLPGWVSRFWSQRDKTGSLPAHPTGAPPTGGMGLGSDMEEARDLAALFCAPGEGSRGGARTEPAPCSGLS